MNINMSITLVKNIHNKPNKTTKHETGKKKSKRDFTFGPRLRFSVGYIDWTASLDVRRWEVRLLLEALLLLLGEVGREVGQPELANELTVSALVHVEVVHVQEAVL